MAIITTTLPHEKKEEIVVEEEENTRKGLEKMNITEMEPETTTMMMSTTTATLPQDLILDNILSRLPDESLIRLGSVCKLWYNSIHHDQHFPSPHFARKHPIVMFHFFNVGRHPPTSRIDNLYYFYLNQVDALMISEENSGGNHNGVELRSLITLPNKNNNNVFHSVVGCFNDLICMYVVSAEGGRSIQICNPSKRQVLNIPTPPIVHSIKAYGFGFDYLTNEYKIVWINVKELEYHCFVYTWESSSSSSSSNSWREVTGVGPCLLSIKGPRSAVSYDGAIYWRTNRHSRLLSFNIHNEKFQFIELPFRQVTIPSRTKHYLEYKGCLCFAALRFHEEEGIDDIENPFREEDISKVQLFILKDKIKQTWIEETFFVPYRCDKNTHIMCIFDQVLVYSFRGDHFLFYNLHSKVSNVVKFPTGYFTEKEHLDVLRQITKNDYQIFNHVSNTLCLGNLCF